MKNELVKNENVSTALSITDASAVGKMFFESGMFTDIKSTAQAVTKILAGAELGIPPFASMSGIHIIQGKPSVGAGLIAARVKGSGKYDYKVIQQDEKACIIDFYQAKEKIGTSLFSIEDAKKAGTKNIDKFPRNMLFARAISNGAKWFCPDMFNGPVYTPEELNDAPQLTEDITHEDIPPTKKKITDAAMEKAIGRIKAGEVILIEKIKGEFDLSENQSLMLAEAIS